MRKVFFFAVLVGVLFFTSCTNKIGGVFVAKIPVLLSEYRAGPAISGADVVVFDSGSTKVIGIGKTDSNGIVNIDVVELPEFVDIKCAKTGYALSFLKNLKTSGSLNSAIEMVMRNADLNSDPMNQKLPLVELDYMDNMHEKIDIRENITTDFKVRVEVDDTYNHVYKIFKPMFDSVPKENLLEFGGKIIGENECVTEATQATFDVSVAGMEGECELNFVIYDRNGNRVHVMEYLNIEKQDKELPENSYIPLNFTDFGTEAGRYNIRAYTRRRGKQVYGSTARTAPEGGNLWINLYWVDYASANVPDNAPPEGYNVYRSFDDVSYEKIGFVNEEYASGKAGDSLPLFTDDSAHLEPGKKVYYAISSVYGATQTEMIRIGSVEPLDSFNVELLSPTLNETGVSRNPNLKWRPTKTLKSGEGTVMYHYVPFIYDWVHGEFGQTTKPMLPILVEGEEYRMCIFTLDTPSSVIVPFSGNKTDSSWGCVWYRICPTGGKLFELDDDKLQSNKDYEWGLNVAYADVSDEDSLSRSIAIDFRSDYTGWGFDTFPGYTEPDFHNLFTTGLK